MGLLWIDTDWVCLPARFFILLCCKKLKRELKAILLSFFDKTKWSCWRSDHDGTSKWNLYFNNQNKRMTSRSVFWKKQKTFSLYFYRHIETLMKICWKNSKKLWKRSPVGSCSHSISRFPKLPLLSLYRLEKIYIITGNFKRPPVN